MENNDLFKNTPVIHISFTTKSQFEIFMTEYKKIYQLRILTSDDFLYLQNIYEKETNFKDILQIFNAISYILLQMSKRIPNAIFMIGETDKLAKINFYLKSIEDSFTEFERLEGESHFFPGKKAYYYILK
jgi:ethanolamine utilization protein EutA (predicted chaperonin)